MVELSEESEPPSGDLQDTIIRPRKRRETSRRENLIGGDLLRFPIEPYPTPIPSNPQHNPERPTRPKGTKPPPPMDREGFREGRG